MDRLEQRLRLVREPPRPDGLVAQRHLHSVIAEQNPTPLQSLPQGLGGPAGALAREQILLKREDMHELGAFKWRGALPTVERYRDLGAKTVVTASTGNHGAAVAWACQRLGLSSIVYGPRQCAEAKLDLISRQGAKVILAGADLDQAKDEARAFATEAGHVFFEDGLESTQYDGYGSIGRELVGQLDSPPSVVVVPVGNGALLIGLGRMLRSLAPEVELVGVVAAEAPVMAQSVAAGEPVLSDQCATFADGLAIRVAIPEAVEELIALDCRFVAVTERQLARAVGTYSAADIRVEGAGAASLAALPQVESDGTVVAVLTGCNIDQELFERAVEKPTTFPD